MKKAGEGRQKKEDEANQTFQPKESGSSLSRRDERDRTKKRRQVNGGNEVKLIG